MKLSVLAILAALLAGPVYACPDGRNVCDEPTPPDHDVPQRDYSDADLDDGRTFEDVSEPEPPMNNGRDGDSSPVDRQPEPHDGDLDDGRG